MNQYDDYELMDRNFDEFIRRGIEDLEWEYRQEFSEVQNIAKEAAQ